jgi:hypothetical protein
MMMMMMMVVVMLMMQWEGNAVGRRCSGKENKGVALSRTLRTKGEKRVLSHRMHVPVMASGVHIGA